jgi:hypothetical protein
MSTETLVIIPSNVKGTGFLRNTYEDQKPYIGGLLNKKEFNDIVDKASKLTALVYSHNRKKDVEGIRPSIKFGLIFSSILLICYIFLMYYGIRDENDKLKIAGFFLLGISAFNAMIIGV